MNNKCDICGKESDKFFQVLDDKACPECVEKWQKQEKHRKLFDEWAEKFELGWDTKLSNRELTIAENAWLNSAIEMMKIAKDIIRS